MLKKFDMKKLQRSYNTNFY